MTGIAKKTRWVEVSEHRLWHLINAELQLLGYVKRNELGPWVGYAITMFDKLLVGSQQASVRAAMDDVENFLGLKSKVRPTRRV